MVMMDMYVINHFGAKIVVAVYELKFFFSTCTLDTEGQPYFLEVAHDVISTITRVNMSAVRSLFFIMLRFFS